MTFLKNVCRFVMAWWKGESSVKYNQKVLFLDPDCGHVGGGLVLGNLPAGSYHVLRVTVYNVRETYGKRLGDVYDADGNQYEVYWNDFKQWWSFEMSTL